jgi:hypothetical protein
MENHVGRAKTAETVMDEMPTWAIIIDRDKLIHRANPVAKKMGLVEGRRCYEVLGQKDRCPWCNTARCIDHQKVMSLTVRVEYTSTGARRVESGGARIDAHQIPLSPDSCLHFGSIGLLGEKDRTSCLSAVGEILGKVPLEISHSVEQVVRELPLNTNNPMDGVV